MSEADPPAGRDNIVDKKVVNTVLALFSEATTDVMAKKEQLQLNIQSAQRLELYISVRSDQEVIAANLYRTSVTHDK